MARFSELLDQKAQDIVRPPLLPIGDYVGKITKPFSVTERKGSDGTIYESIGFPCSVQSEVEVDEEDLAEFGPVKGTPFTVDFMLNTTDDDEGETARARTLYNIKNFLIACGLTNEDDDRELNAIMADAVGAEFGITFKHDPDKNDPERFYLRPQRTYVLD